jgi:hypothetical protein
MGHFEVAWGVANCSVAATRIPTQHSFLCEGHASEGFKALRECDVLRKGCDNIRPPHLVQDVPRFAKKVRIGLAVFAVAHAPTNVRGVANVALQRAAPAPQWMIHVFSLLGTAWSAHAV